MSRLSQGSLHLFRIAGIDVFLHWSWFLVAVFEIASRSGRYSTVVWNVLEYLALFGIVLLHEFGHALACRQVGGTANRIMLWPLGGVAYVNPPQRPGATLWSIAAGPLVNVALLPILGAAVWLGRTGLAAVMPDVYHLILTLLKINTVLLIFNILPIYPLDGGQILRALLWFVFGRARSLVAAAVVGLAGAAGFIFLSFRFGYSWFFLIAVFMLLSSWSGLKNALELLRSEKLPRRFGAVCPGCGASPPVGPLWKCKDCVKSFDTFESNAICPNCETEHPNTMCAECRAMHPISEWSEKPQSSAADAVVEGAPALHQ
jgi:Zn-dependent protease